MMRNLSLSRHLVLVLLAAFAVGNSLQLRALDDKKSEKAAEAPEAPGSPADSITEGTVTVGGQAIA
jgi:hypothetical protein